MNKGKLIVVEGACDGIGKTTQYQLLGKRLKEAGEKVVMHHFPSYGKVQAKLVEEYLNETYGRPQDLSPYFINSLYAIDRAITWNNELKKEYDDESIILLDRYTTSSLIYQAALMKDQEKKEFINYVCDYEYEKLRIKRPDQVIFLTAPFELALEMMRERKNNEGIKNDIYEADQDFMKKVYENALFIADYLDWDIVDCEENRQMKSIEKIHEKVYQLVK